MRIAAPATAAALAAVRAPAARAQDVRFDADPAHSNAARQAKQYERAGRHRDAARMRALSLVPQARWFNGGTPKQVRRGVDEAVTAAAERQAVPVLVAYNVPNRDCSLYSAGGARNARGYRAWVTAFARGIGDRPALVVLEPDALAGLCGTGRLDHLRGAVDRLARAQTSVYIDAGHSNWLPARVMARRLRRCTPSAPPGSPSTSPTSVAGRDRRLRHAHLDRPRRRPVRDRHQPQRPRPWNAPRGKRGLVQPAGRGWARARRRRRATRWWPRSCGSRRPASPTARARTATTRRPASGGRGTRSG